MATLTFTYPGGTQDHAHAGGTISIASNQRGVLAQRVNGTVISPLADQNGQYPLNKGTFELSACTVRCSVGAHAFGGDRANIVVEIN